MFGLDKSTIKEISIFSQLENKELKAPILRAEKLFYQKEENQLLRAKKDTQK